MSPDKQAALVILQFKYCVQFRTGPVRVHPDPRVRKMDDESWTCAGIRAGCPVWRQCWTRAFLSGCCCGPEAPQACEPEDLNESGTWETERERFIALCSGKQYA